MTPPPKALSWRERLRQAREDTELARLFQKKAEKQRDELRALLDLAFPPTVGKLRGIQQWSPEAFTDFIVRVERALDGRPKPAGTPGPGGET